MPHTRPRRIVRRAVMVLPAVLVAVPLISIVDSLSTIHTRCPECNHRLTTTGPFGEPLVRMYNVKCGWCGYGVSYYPDDEAQ